MIAGCVALLALLGVCTYGFILKGSDTIFPNVYVAGVNVGGLKRDAAINAVTLAVEQETATDTLTVVLPDRTIDFTPEITNVALNPDEAADAAMNYARLRRFSHTNGQKRPGRTFRSNPGRISIPRISAISLIRPPAPVRRKRLTRPLRSMPTRKPSQS